MVDTHNASELNLVSESASVTTARLYPAIDHRVIERFLITAFKELCHHHQVDDITVTTHGATAALIDKQGELMLPVLDYECPLPDDLADQYVRHCASFDQTGSPRLPGGLNICAQLLWQQLIYSKHFALAETLLNWPQYWVFRLTGERHNDVTSLGAHSNLYNPRQRCYSPLVETLQWARLMPLTRQPNAYVNVTNTRITELLDLEAPLRVYTGIHDSNALLVPPLLANKSPFNVVSTGTSVGAAMLIKAPVEPLTTHACMHGCARYLPAACRLCEAMGVGTEVSYCKEVLNRNVFIRVLSI